MTSEQKRAHERLASLPKRAHVRVVRDVRRESGVEGQKNAKPYVRKTPAGIGLKGSIARRGDAISE